MIPLDYQPTSTPPRPRWWRRLLRWLFAADASEFLLTSRPALTRDCEAGRISSDQAIRELITYRAWRRSLRRELRELDAEQEKST